MKSNMYIFFLFIINFSSVQCQTNMKTTHQTGIFPELKAKTLAGRKIVFPTSITGQKTFIVLVFEDKGVYENAQNQANEWAFYWEKSLKSQGINFYEIPMMSAKYAWFKIWIDSGMRSGIEKEKHDKVACFYGDKEKYIDLLQIKDLSQAHVFILGEKGEILQQVSGKISEDKIQMIKIVAN